MSVSRSTQLLRVARLAATRPAITAAPRSAGIHIGRVATTSSLKVIQQRSALPAVFSQTRSYAASSGLSAQEIQNRIIEVLRSFEKVDPAKVSNSSAFTSDLGLDSLDAVEVVMAIEEEFSIEIPDAEADNITTVQEAIDYISKTPEAH